MPTIRLRGSLSNTFLDPKLDFSSNELNWPNPFKGPLKQMWINIACISTAKKSRLGVFEKKWKKRKSPKYLFLFPPGLPKPAGAIPRPTGGPRNQCDTCRESRDFAIFATHAWRILLSGVQQVYCWQEAKFTKRMASSDQNPRVRRRDPGNIARRPLEMFLTELDRSRAPTAPTDPATLIFRYFGS